LHRTSKASGSTRISAAMVKVIYRLKSDRISVADEFEVTRIGKAVGGKAPEGWRNPRRFA
jgi:hypothetical protein